MIWGMDEYTIKKGRHSCNKFFRFVPFFYDTLSYDVCFTESCLYNIEDNDKYDINKLFGFSRGWHHKNSARFGWNCIDGKINIYAYCYVDGERKYKEVCSVNILTNYQMSINDFGSFYLFSVYSNRNINEVIIEKNKTTSFGYKLYPYFGGNKKSPQKIKILMKELDF
jgi:hypothetical protein